MEKSGTLILPVTKTAEAVTSSQYCILVDELWERLRGPLLTPAVASALVAILFWQQPELLVRCGSTARPAAAFGGLLRFEHIGSKTLLRPGYSNGSLLTTSQTVIQIDTR